MHFSVVANTFSRIEQESSRTAITQLLADLFAQVSAEEASFLAHFCLGQLYPSYYNKNMNIAEKTAIRSVALLLGRPVDVVASGVKEAGDIGTYLYASSEITAQVSDSMSVAEIKTHLHEILEVSGAGSQEHKETLLSDLLGRLTPLEQCFVVRSVVGALRLGFSEMTMIDAYSWMVGGDKRFKSILEHCFNVSADIGHVLYLLKTTGIEQMRGATMIPGIPVRPAAADRLADSQAIFDKLGRCVAQPKLDGFRLQIHRWLDEQGVQQTRFFSRNLHDMSEMFPDLVLALASINATSLIMEGEAIVHDSVTGNFLPFQDTVKRKRKHGVDEAAAELPLTLYVFDLLLINGESMLDHTHAQRRERLCALLPRDGQVRVIEEEVIESSDQLSLYFEHAMSAGLEGIVVKNNVAKYQPGKRNSNWIKLKRQERGELADTIDCVILGYYAGAGKRAQFGIGAFLVGIYNPASDGFETIAKVGTGLSDEQWRALRGRCDHAVVTVQPHNVVCASGLIPDVWVAPEIVCSVRADDITRSPVHSAGKTKTSPGYALRFPRIMGYRPDKDAVQATQVSEIESLYKIQDLKHKKS
ncbi:MAG: ligase 1 [Candidatus Dependentiae bacterium]|nr:ligase 1 [Candidatus Dependentiae bacterium]